MLKLDENTYVNSPNDVLAIRSCYISSPTPYSDLTVDSNEKNTIVDPGSCEVLIGGNWLKVHTPSAVVASILEGKE